MVLIDTSSWVEALREAGRVDARDRVQRLLNRGEAAWCDMVRIELWNGARGRIEKQRLGAFEDELPCLAIDSQTWDLAAGVAQSARSAGVTVPATDLVIFACARRHQVELEHSDDHFARLAELIK